MRNLVSKLPMQLDEVVLSATRPGPSMLIRRTERLELPSVPFELETVQHLYMERGVEVRVGRIASAPSIAE